MSKGGSGGSGGKGVGAGESCGGGAHILSNWHLFSRLLVVSISVACVTSGSETAFGKTNRSIGLGSQIGVVVSPCWISVDAVKADRLTGTGVPLEGSSVTVSYTVTGSPILAASAGELRWAVMRNDGIENRPNGSMRIENLAKGEARKGSFSFKAPAAGKLQLKLEFARDDAPGVGEFKEASCKHAVEFNVATRFVVSLESLHIHETLARLKDTDYANVEASLGGQFNSNSKFIGDLSGGDHEMLMPVGPFECVPGDHLGDVLMKILIINAGFKGSDTEKFGQFKNALDGVVAQQFGIENYKAGVSAFLTAELLAPDCDGVVFAEARGYSTDLLNKLTLKDGWVTETIQSVFGRKGACNANGSRYDGHVAFYRNGTIYRVKVTTGDVEDAGTYSHVYIRLTGEKGVGRELHLDDYKENWHRGVTEEFMIGSQDLGDLRSLTVRHNNKNNDRSWFLDKITVEDIENTKSWVFPANAWLADDRGDRKIERELKPQ